MDGQGQTLCIQCGKEVPGPDLPGTFELNRLPDGRPCPGCRERALEALPSLLPGANRPTLRVLPRYSDVDGLDESSDGPLGA